MRRLAALTAAAVVMTGVLAGCGGTNWADKCTTTAGVVECSADQRTKIDDVSGQLLDGANYSTAQDRGKVLVVNFWGSWCPPCRAEADDLEKTYQATKAQGVTFLGVNLRDDRDSAIQFERGRVTYPSIYDFDGKVSLQFDVTQTSTPATLIIDREGRIAMAIRQATTFTQLEPLVEKIASEKN
ncbi:TlpA disulfide reductase family protein [Actinoplanes sp. TBRC 11911]|uniref:TlpA disulfide reductase family protein n=1 Tax=Actinoplanes sp. TBRC 11911 TaxID=2729386 RepID=UPI00289E87BE|nr:TlpA disulfide reductase family protein [Actinoplanes sp. TBRC 11911]